MARGDTSVLTKEEVAHVFSNPRWEAQVGAVALELPDILAAAPPAWVVGIQAIFARLSTTLGYDFSTCKTALPAYVPMGACHAWNKFFGLWLARKVFPKEEWLLREGVTHTTVYCPARRMVFDLLYWATDYRQNDYIRGNPYSSQDASLGARKAMIDSAVMVSHSDDPTFTRVLGGKPPRYYHD